MNNQILIEIKSLGGINETIPTQTLDNQIERDNKRDPKIKTWLIYSR